MKIFDILTSPHLTFSESKVQPEFYLVIVMRQTRPSQYISVALTHKEIFMSESFLCQEMVDLND